MNLIRLLKLMGKSLFPYLCGIVIMTISFRLFTIVKALLVKDVFNMLGNGGDIFKIIQKNILFGILCIVIYIFSSYVYKVQSKKGVQNLKEIVFGKILRLPMKYFDNNNSSDLISRFFYDINQATDIYNAKLRRFFAPAISVVVYCIPMFYLNVPITICLILSNIIAMILNSRFVGITKKLKKDISKKNATMTEKLNNAISGIEVTKIFGIGNKIADDYIKESNEFFELEKKDAILNGEVESINTLFDFLCSIVFLCLGILFVAKGYAGVSSLAAIYTMYSDFSSQFLRMCKYFPDLIGCVTSAKRLFELLEEVDEEQPNFMQEKNSEYCIEFSNVNFSYDGQRKILDNFNMKVKPNCITALTGVSGKGKSTIVKLILGFYKPESGEIYINGKSLYELGLENARQLISYVPQEPYIFNVSIEENIRYGKPNASQDEIIKASKIANAHEFIMQKDGGYKYLAGERGNKLSGGEKQRIAIARAILKNSPIFLFDEATSSLDNENEKAIQSAIKVLTESNGELENEIQNPKAIFMIAHRLSSIQSADDILKL